jgi:hypothetical protein
MIAGMGAAELLLQARRSAGLAQAELALRDAGISEPRPAGTLREHGAGITAAAERAAARNVRVSGSVACGEDEGAKAGVVMILPFRARA